MKLWPIAALLSLGVLDCKTGSPPPPDASAQYNVLADATRYALTHEANLPNFVCTQTTRSFENVNNGGWRPIDLIVERLTHFAHREINEAMLNEQSAAMIPGVQLRRTYSSGEFGAIMRAIFLPQSETRFRWQEWVDLRGKRMQVYAYRIPAFKSSYHIEVAEQSMDLRTGYHGLVFIDDEKHAVHRITLYADEIPRSFPIQDISLSLDYDYIRIGDANYLLPLQCELRSRQGVSLKRNDVGYSDYRKLSVLW